MCPNPLAPDRRLLAAVIERPNTARNLFLWEAGLRQPGGIDMDAAAALSHLALEEDAVLLKKISSDSKAYDEERRRSGLCVECSHVLDEPVSRRALVRMKGASSGSLKHLV